MSVAYNDSTVHVTAIHIKPTESIITNENNNAVNLKNNLQFGSPDIEVDGAQDNSPHIHDINYVSVPESNGTATKDHSLSSAVSSNSVPIRGIDDLLPADKLWTVNRDHPVKLRIGNSGQESIPAVTIPTHLESTVGKIPNHIAMGVKRNGSWIKWTYSSFLKDVRKAAKSFIKLGLELHGGVGIIGFNAPEWVLADLGAIYAGGLTAGIYTTNSPDACRYVAENCEANIIVVENNQQLGKILQVRDQLPHLKAIVQYTGEVAAQQPNIYSWSEFMALSDQVPDSVLEERMKMLAPNKCCMLIYTSGTTGNPKGVMLSHDNITWTAKSVKKAAVENGLDVKFGELCQVSYLPLSHVAAQLLDIFLTIEFGGAIFFAQPDALKGSLANTLKEVRPHVLFGVPRVWEKMMEGIQNVGRNTKGVKRKIALWAKGIGLKGNYSLMNKGSLPLGWSLANNLVFKGVRRALGLDRCQICISGAAPITKETIDFFLSLNIPIYEVYGMSESTGPHTATLPNRWRVTSVGAEFPGINTKLINPDSEGNSEIVMVGRHVFMGYLNDEAKTRESLDENADLHSGDIGRKDKDGFLYVTGRIKELLITAGGENVAPVPIEEAVKEALPIVSQCMLVGDKKKFLSMLLTLKTEVNPDTLEPTEKFTPAALDWLRSVGSKAVSILEVTEKEDPAVINAIQSAINAVNKKAISRAQSIQKWSILPKDFSIPGGELGPTMKMKRPVIAKMYVKTINVLYEDDTAS